jgi:acetate kinase
MGMTPLAGLPMGTRSGDIDAGVMEYVMKQHNLSMDEMMTILNKKSGVQGISEVSSDFRDLDNAAAAGNEQAALACEVFEYGVRKMIAEYAAAMGGVDAVIFTAGVGENSADMRLKFVEGLEFMGIKIDPEKNACRGVERIVSTDDSKVKVLVIPTNEELMIALDTAEIVNAQ